jgi:PAS domain S-box-containing protein
VEALSRQLAETSARLLQAETTGIRILEADELVLRACWGEVVGLRLQPRVKLGEAVSGVVGETSETRVVSSRARSPASRELVGGKDRHELLAVPLETGGCVLGVLNAVTGRAGGFTSEHLAIARALGPLAAAALHNAQLFEAEQQRRQHLERLVLQNESLVEIERELVMTFDPERLFQLIVTRARAIFGGECGISLVEDGRLAAKADTDAAALSRRVVIGEGVAGLTAAACRGVLVNDYPRWRSAIPWAVERGLQHVMSQPLMTRAGLLGVITVSRRGAIAPTFDEADLASLARFAALAAVAIQNAQAHGEHRRIEDALRESEQRYRLLAENMADVIALFDMELRPIYVSPSVLRLRGYTPQEAMAQSLAERLTPSSAALAASAMRAELAQEEAGQEDPERFITLELEQPCKDGSTVWVENTLKFVRDDARRPIGIISVARDITARKQAETVVRERDAQLRQSQKMEAVGRLAGGVAHDFNNLLTIMAGRAELLLSALPLTDPSRPGLELITQSVDRAAALTKQLLAFSRKQPLVPEVVSLNDVIDRVARMLDRVIGEDVEVALRLDPELGVVRADASQIEQVLVNLALNARDAMPRGGRLSIETKNVDLDEPFVTAHPDASIGPHVALHVRDTGVGMSAEVRARLFEPFFTTKERDKGTGLGLATAYGIIRQHGGFIDVESAPAMGATFTIYLKRAEERQVPTERRDVSPPRGGSETILLVEDAEGVREFVREVLASAGYRVIAAPAPLEALDLADRADGPIDLLLTDVVLPQMSGRGLATRLAPDHPGMRVLYISGYTDEQLGDHNVLDPGVVLLPKPFTPDVLIRKVREVLDG